MFLKHLYQKTYMWYFKLINRPFMAIPIARLFTFLYVLYKILILDGEYIDLSNPLNVLSNSIIYNVVRSSSSFLVYYTKCKWDASY